MFCGQCGGQVPQGAAACPTCGAAVAAAAPSSALKAGGQGQGVATYDPPRSKMTAGLLGIFLGGLGIHRFYLGYTKLGIIQLLVSIFTCGLGGLWGLVEGILIIAGSTITTDATGRALRE
jgi:TM2 domain-containing membrane protein YozV